MVLRFKVWRLQREHHPYGDRLVLRNKQGWIQKMAKTPEEEYALRKWYEKYHAGEMPDPETGKYTSRNLEQLLAVRRLKEHVRRIKQDVRRRGFVKQLSIYGITKNLETNKRVYRRYEIFKAELFRQDEVRALHDLFRKNPPISQAGIFIYHNDKLFAIEGDKVTLKGTETLGYKGERRSPIIG